MPEFRLILLGLGLLLLGGIWWWGGRRSAQAPGNSALRETSATPQPQRYEDAQRREDVQRREDAARYSPVVDDDSREVSLEPLSIRTADFDRVPVLEDPMLVNVEPDEFRELEARAHPIGAASPPLLTKVARMTTGAIPGVEPATAGEIASTATTTPVPVLVTTPPLPPPPPVPTLNTETTERLAAPSTQVPNASERQKIISVRVSAMGEGRWPGTALLAAFESHGLAFGRYQVFHRRHVDGRTLFCIASLVEPGTFDVVRMASEEFRGVTLFAVLPGPMEPLLTVDELLSAARDLAADLSGVVQDSKGVMLSPQRADALRDDVARFQASLPRA